MISDGVSVKTHFVGECPKYNLIATAYATALSANRVKNVYVIYENKKLKLE